MEHLKILHLEDSPQDAELIFITLLHGGIQCEVERVDNEEQFCSAIDSGGIDLIISDFSVPGFDGKAALNIARRRAPDIPFIFVSGTIGEIAAIDALVAGATDYVLKHQFSRLIPAIRRAQREAVQRRERKRVEAQLLRTQRMESIGTLASGIAHDLNNVLAPILMAVQLLKEKSTDSSSRHMLDTVEQSAIRGANIVRQVLTFARGLEGQQAPVQTKYLLSNMERMLIETFPKSIRIQSEVPKYPWTVIGDPTQLDQLLLNLCLNARDAMPHGGILKIRAQNIILEPKDPRLEGNAAPGAYVVIEIVDTGHGIPEAIIERIFEPFFTTKEAGKGTGLGLSTVSAILKSHRGFITVSSESGKGSCFKVYLPAKESSETTHREESLKNVPAGHGELILIVDDELAIRDIAQVTLESYGYRVCHATNGAEAVARYASQGTEVAAVLLDMMMPVMDGAATVRALRTINPHVKIIAVSGLMDKNTNITEEDMASVRAMLSKPYTSQKLLSTLNDILR